MNIRRWAFALVGGVLIAVTLYAAFLFNVSDPFSPFHLNNSGVFGDSFGLLTSLFSGLAFSGLILTILQQREDLILQRGELKLQRDELKETREEIKFQNFERTFFEMLRLHNSILDSMDLRAKNHNDIIASGRDCFRIFYDNLKQRYAPYILYDINDSHEKITETYIEFWTKYKQDLGHYFRYLYRIFKYVDESFVSKDQKKLYASTIRAQLSDLETALLFYNCLSTHGYEKFKPLAEKYALFDNLPKGLLFNLKHKDLYEPSAFDDKK